MNLWEIVKDEIELVIPFDTLPITVRTHIERAGARVLSETLFDSDHAFQESVRDHITNTLHRTQSVVKAPAAFDIYSRMCIAEVLSHYPSTVFMLRPVPQCELDEDTIVDLHSLPTMGRTGTLTGEEAPIELSCSTWDDERVESIKSLPISEARPYRLTEVIPSGGMQYSAHAFVNAAKIRIFFPVSELQAGQCVIMLPSSHSLYNVFYQFTKQVVEAFARRHADTALVGPSAKQSVPFSRHLTLTLRVNNEILANGDFFRRITTVICTNKPTGSLALLCSMPGLRRQLALAHTDPLAAIDHDPLPLPISHLPRGVYSISLVLSHLLRTFPAPKPWSRRWWT